MNEANGIEIRPLVAELHYLKVGVFRQKGTIFL